MNVKSGVRMGALDHLWASQIRICYYKGLANIARIEGLAVATTSLSASGVGVSSNKWSF